MPDASIALALDQLDLVTIWVLPQGDYRGAALDWSRLAGDRASFFAHRAACRGGVGNLDGDMSVSGVEIVSIDAVIVGQLQHRVLSLVVIADERQRVFLFRPIGGPQKRHAEHAGVKTDRALQVAHAKHGVKNTHPSSDSFVALL